MSDRYPPDLPAPQSSVASWPPPDPSHHLVGASVTASRQPQFAPKRPPHPTLPWQAGGGAIAVLVVALVGSKFILDLLIDFEWPIVLYVAILGVLGYGPSLLWWRFSTSRWGSGRPIDDVGARPKWSDLGWGPVIWLAAIGVQVVAVAFVLRLDIPLSNNTDGIDELRADRSYVIALVISAVIAAPLVEEIVFRGLVMRSMLSKLPTTLAIVAQGVLFGVAHVDPVRGVGNVGLAIVLSGVGIVLGGFAYLLRRIGPAIVAHAIFNGVVMVLVLSGLADQIREDGPDVFDDGATGSSVVVAQSS